MNLIQKILLAPLLVISASLASEQTLFGSGDQKIEHGFFGAPVVSLTRIDGHTRTLVGAEGGWIVNHGFYLGLGGYGMVKGLTTDQFDTAGNRQYMQMGYGGLILGYTFASDRLFHVGFQQLIGGGGAVLTDDRYGNNDCDENDDDDNHHTKCEATGFFAWEPRLNAEVNITKFARLAVGAGYRLAWMPEEKFGYKDNDLGGPTASVALKFGKF